MIWLQRMGMVCMICFTIGFVWWEKTHSSAIKESRWFSSKHQELQKNNQELVEKNLRLKQKIIALRYDHRVIEQEARKQLSFSVKGEITLVINP